MVANPALTGFTAPKILWLRRHEPKHFDKTRKILLPKDDIRRRLTGEYATDMSDASGMLLLDVARDWSRSCSKLQLDELASVTNPKNHRKLTKEAASAMGLSTDCIVSAGQGTAPRAPSATASSVRERSRRRSAPAESCSSTATT
jgi:xylulokinase